MIYSSVTELIGNTPLVRLHAIEKIEEIDAQLIGKVEFLNPAGSIKDRAAYKMLESLPLKAGDTIIEPTSGNTGIGLACLCAARGIQAIFTMPSSMSKERIDALKAYGAKIILTEASKGMQGAVDKALELSKEIENSYIPGQFTNLMNPQAHYETTGPEIWKDTEGKVDVLIAGIGTGGTLSGAGRYLKEKNPNIQIIGVEPMESPLLSQGTAGPHGIQGIGANFIPDTLDQTIYDEILPIETKEAYRVGKMLAQKEGLLVGISSGACVAAAIQCARREEYHKKQIVCILPDTGSRYLSTEMFD